MDYERMRTGLRTLRILAETPGTPVGGREDLDVDNWHIPVWAPRSSTNCGRSRFASSNAFHDLSDSKLALLIVAQAL